VAWPAAGALISRLSAVGRQAAGALISRLSAVGRQAAQGSMEHEQPESFSAYRVGIPPTRLTAQTCGNLRRV
jgi:hypothetical protein